MATWKKIIVSGSNVELNNITKNYDSLKAIDNLSFSVEKNEFAVLFGSSAAGKTTSLRCISGLEQIDTGEVYFATRLGISILDSPFSGINYESNNNYQIIFDKNPFRHEVQMNSDGWQAL